MEKQQEILLSVVSESRNNAHRNSYQQHNMPISSILSQFDPNLRIGVEQNSNNANLSAFKPSRPSPTAEQEGRGPVTPMTHQSHSATKGFQGLSQGGSNMSQVQLLSEICSSIMNKQM